MRNSSEFWRFLRQISRRRRDLLRDRLGRNVFYPANGVAWFPDNRESTQSEAFIVLFVAELESYIEGIVDKALDSFENRFKLSGLAECQAGSDYIVKIVDKRLAWQRNNNANWKRISEYLIFVGFSKARFPDNMWEDIESIVAERGNIVHKSLGIRQISDPRQLFENIERVIVKLQRFDRDFMLWHSCVGVEQSRLENINLKFIPGLGSINSTGI